MLPVFARQSCVYSALTFCSSAFTADVLAARDTKIACWVCKVEDITEQCREGGMTLVSKDGEENQFTLRGSLALHGSRG